MAFIEKLIASEENVSKLAAVGRGEVVELDEHEMLLLDAMTKEGAITPLGRVMLGRGIVESETELFGEPALVGRIEEDHENPDGVWLQYVPL